MPIHEVVEVKLVPLEASEPGYEVNGNCALGVHQHDGQFIITKLSRVPVKGEYIQIPGHRAMLVDTVTHMPWQSRLHYSAEIVVRLLGEFELVDHVKDEEK